MAYIQNIPMSGITSGYHIRILKSNSALIQIVDPGVEFPKPKFEFGEVHQFKFLDAEDSDPYHDDVKFSDDQAKQIVEILQRALANDHHVVVHCHAGICRSGAVTEVGVIMGFYDYCTIRQPNLRVKHKLLKQLGLTYENS